MTDGGTARPRLARVGRAIITPPEGQLPFDRTEDVLQVLLQGTSVETYGRTWYLGKVQVSNGWAFSRLGFASGTEVEVWDEVTKDFTEQTVNAGTTSPFVVRLDDLRVAFQLRSGSIKAQSFAHALQSLMREATNEPWRVTLETRQVPLAEWMESVDRITRFSFTLKPPNPNYVGRPTIEQVVADTAASVVTLALTAPDDSGDGLRTDSDVVREAIDHVERGYGSVSAAGERVEGDKTVRVDWRNGGETAQDEAPVGETGEVGESGLRATFGAHSVQDELDE